MEIDKDIKILVVDDSPAIRMIASKMFKKMDFFNVSLADDGDTGLEELKKESYDLVIADMNMPKMSGLELLAEMKNDEKFKDIPFLLVTAEEDQEEIMSAIRAGISNYMTKPWEISKLTQKMERVFKFDAERKNRSAGEEGE